MADPVVGGKPPSEAELRVNSLEKKLSSVNQRIGSLGKALSKVNQRTRKLEKYDWEEIQELNDGLSDIREGLRNIIMRDLKKPERKDFKRLKKMSKSLDKKLESMVMEVRKKETSHRWLLVILLLLELLFMFLWGVAYEFSTEGLGAALGYLGLIIALLSLVFLVVVARSGYFETKRRRFKIELVVPLAVLSGYLLIGAGIGGALITMNRLQPTLESGWSTSSIEDGELVIRLQAPSNLGISPLEAVNVSVPITITMGFDGGAEPPLVGNATVAITGMDSPLAPNTPTPPSLRLNDAVREDTILVDFMPSGRVESETLDLQFEVRYNISAGFLGTFIGSETGSLSISLKGSEFSSGWHLLFIFAGILTSFWWRVANHYLHEGEVAGLSSPNGRKEIAKYLLLPFFSLVIALAVFRQFQESLTIGNDPLVSATAGFAYGFFWESASQKFGKTVLSVTKPSEEKKSEANVR